MSVETHPRRLAVGPWTDGYALDVHTLRTTYLGDDQYGHPRFDNVRSPIGELLFRLKYRNDQKAVDPLAEAVKDFIKNIWRVPIDAIVAAPPSRVRTIQPVDVVANALAVLLSVPICTGCLTKLKDTPQLKDITDYDKRKEVLAGAFTVNPELTAGKNLLLFDDLYGSGATVVHIVEVLKDTGCAKAIYLLTLTAKR